MTIQEKIYSWISVSVALIFSGSAVWFFAQVKGSDESYNLPAMFGLICALHAVALGSTSFWNLYKKNLDIVPTIIQIISYIMAFGYGLPLALWALVLLVLKMRRERRIAGSKTHSQMDSV